MSPLGAASEVRDERRNAVEAVARSFERMGEVGAGAGGLNIVLWTDRERAAAEAREIQREMDAGTDFGPLMGAPVAIKANIATLQFPTTCASRILEGYVSPSDATVATCLRAPGAIVHAMTN